MLNASEKSMKIRLSGREKTFKTLPLRLGGSVLKAIINNVSDF